MAFEGAVERRERVRVWLMLAAGSLAAASEAWFVATRLRTPPRHSGGAFWVGGLFWAAVWVGMSVSGGAGQPAWLAGRSAGGRQEWRGCRSGLESCGSGMGAASLLDGDGGARRDRGGFCRWPRWRRRRRCSGRGPYFTATGRGSGLQTIAVNGVMHSLDGLPPTGAPPVRSGAGGDRRTVVSAVCGDWSDGFGRRRWERLWLC